MIDEFWLSSFVIKALFKSLLCQCFEVSLSMFVLSSEFFNLPDSHLFSLSWVVDNQLKHEHLNTAQSFKEKSGQSTSCPKLKCCSPQLFCNMNRLSSAAVYVVIFVLVFVSIVDMKQQSRAKNEISRFQCKKALLQLDSWKIVITKHWSKFPHLLFLIILANRLPDLIVM